MSVRWIIRDGGKALQHQVPRKSTVEWEDVPTVEEPPDPIRTARITAFLEAAELADAMQDGTYLDGTTRAISQTPANIMAQRIAVALRRVAHGER